jgi:alpha-ketoglutarate-dependent 2,4-dichlorophenoxyacetate dioxygenase
MSIRTMSLQLRKLHPHYAAEVGNVDLRGADNPALFEEICAALDQHAVLVFRDQPFSDDDQARFTQALATAAERSSASVDDGAAGGEAQLNEVERSIVSDLVKVSNLDDKNEIVAANDRRRISKLGNRIWHTDGSSVDPAGRYTLLSGRVIPEVRADTEFTDTRVAYDSLDADLRQTLEDLHVFHSITYSRALLGFSFSKEEADKLKGAVHPLARTLPASGRKALYLGAHASHVVEWPVPEGRLLLRDLTEHATQEAFLYRHIWRTHDLLIWDNRSTLHRARPFDDSRHHRDMRRTMTMDPRGARAVHAAPG